MASKKTASALFLLTLRARSSLCLQHPKFHLFIGSYDSEIYDGLRGFAVIVME